VQPRRGFSKDLFSLAQYGASTSIMMFTGPHGRSPSIERYENIIMIATGFGIAAHLPYLKKLIHEHEKRHIRRIHLIW
jgi:NAD(P)H-flavin reductase